jgi:hypothetical protein
MPRYRVSFTRDWGVGRWGFLDRFFHDLGGREADPGSMQNAWLLEYKGTARRLGRQLAQALNIQEADLRRFGPIFDIEELSEPRSAKPKSQPETPAPPTEIPPEPGAIPRMDASRVETTESKAAPEGPAAPSWLGSADVEDIELEVPPEEVDVEEAESGAAIELGPPPNTVTSRLDDLFRIRSRKQAEGGSRAETLAALNKRRSAPSRTGSA